MTQSDLCVSNYLPVREHRWSVCESLCNQNVLNHIHRIEFSVHLVMGGFYSIPTSNENAAEVNIESPDEYIIGID